MGGAVRDILLGRPVKDFDFVIEGLVRPVGKKLADLLHGKYYVLDDERDMVRVIFSPGTRNFHCIDLAQINGATIEEDLFGRDFTINAIAIDFMEKNSIIDPMGGANDLKEKRLRMCNLESLNNDPLRGMRSIRMAIELELEMDPPLINALHELSSQLDKSSMERYRDELFKILSVGKPNISVQLLDKYRFLDHLFAEKKQLELPVLAEQLRKTEMLLKTVAAPFDEAQSSNLIAGLTVLKLGKYRDALTKFYEKDDSNLQERKAIVFYTLIASQFGQASTAEKRLDQNSRRLVLSTALISLGKKRCLVPGVDYLAKAENLANFDMYKFLENMKAAGIDGILLSLAVDPAIDSPAFEPSFLAKNWINVRC